MICDHCRGEFESLLSVFSRIFPEFGSSRLCESCFRSVGSGGGEEGRWVHRIVAFEGRLEIFPDGFGFVETATPSEQAPETRVYVSPSQIQRHQLRTGDLVRGIARKAGEGERYDALVTLELVNGHPPTWHQA